MVDEGGDGRDVIKELAGLPGPDCPPVCPAQSPQQRLAPLAGGDANQQSRPRASDIIKSGQQRFVVTGPYFVFP